jgi:hypothetical protein
MWSLRPFHPQEITRKLRTSRRSVSLVWFRRSAVCRCGSGLSVLPQKKHCTRNLHTSGTHRKERSVHKSKPVTLRPTRLRVRSGAKPPRMSSNTEMIPVGGNTEKSRHAIFLLISDCSGRRAKFLTLVCNVLSRVGACAGPPRSSLPPIRLAADRQ